MDIKLIIVRIKEIIYCYRQQNNYVCTRNMTTFAAVPIHLVAMRAFKTEVKKTVLIMHKLHQKLPYYVITSIKTSDTTARGRTHDRNNALIAIASITQNHRVQKNKNYANND